MSALLTYVCVWLATSCVALLFVDLYHLEPDRFLKLSIYGWVSYALRYAFLLIATAVDTSGISRTLADVCELWSAVFLLEGGCSFANYRQPRLLRPLWLGVSAAGIAANALGTSMILTGGLAHLLAGGMQILTGLVFIRSRRIRGVGKLAVGGTFILWGIHKLGFFWLSGTWDLAGRWISALLALLVCVGMILVYFEDARRVLVESEARFRALIEQAPDAIIVYDADLRRLVDANTSAEKLFGRSREELLRSDPQRLFNGMGGSGRRDEDAFSDHAERALRGESLEFELPVLRADGVRLACETRLTRLPSDRHRLVRASYIDITERNRAEEALRRLNRELRAVSKCNQAMVRAEDELKLLDDICRITCDDAGYRMAWVGYAVDDEARNIRPVAWSGVEEGYLGRAELTWADTERGRGPAGKAIRNGETAFIQDFATDPEAAPWRDGALRRGYRSSIALPLKDDGAASFGVLCIYSTEPRAFTPEEVRLLEELAGDMAFGIVVLRALRERDRIAEELNRSEEKYRTLFEESFDGLFIMSPDWEILDMNKTGIRLFGYDASGEVSRLDLAQDLFASSPDRKRIQAMIDDRGTAEYEGTLKTKKGDLMTTYCALTAVKDARGVTISYRGIIRDITELKRAEEMLKESELRYRSITESLTDYQYRVRVVDGRAVETIQGPGCATVTGYAPQEFDADPYLWVRMIAPEDREPVQERVRRILAGEESPPFEHRIIRKDGAARWVCDTIILRKDSSGRLLSYDGVIKDITERKEAESKLQENLLEKEVLLQEVHHRVKNNLQIVCSLINLQRDEEGGSSPTGRLLVDTEARVRAMSFVHEILYQSDNFASVGFSSYVSYLCAHLIETYAVDPHRVRLVLSVEDIRLPLDKAVPCGLLINELVANALKHAFPNGRSGTVEVSMVRIEGGMVSLAVTDDGIGASGTDLAKGKRKSIGISLVKSLAVQLGGEYRPESAHGVVARVVFPA
jgi:PAS domain S-box-containing protein